MCGWANTENSSTPPTNNGQLIGHRFPLGVLTLQEERPRFGGAVPLTGSETRTVRVN
jgi:hypothetical protein